MEQPFPPVRRRILLALLASIVIFAALVLVIFPLAINFASPVIQQTRLNYIWSTPPLAIVLIGLAYWYMVPIAQLRQQLSQGQDPSVELVSRARRVAFNTPVYLFTAQVGTTILATFLTDIGGLLLIQGYELALYFSKSFLVVVTTVITALLLALVARWQLRSVLATTNRLIPPSFRLSSKEGHRFSIRTRLLSVILALTIIACYLPSILGLNLVHQAAQVAANQHHKQWVENTIQDVAPLLDEDALILHVEEAELPDNGQAFIIDIEGRFITQPPATPPSWPEPDEQSANKQIILPLNRPGRDWYLGVVYEFDAGAAPLVR
jgi:hypothetical protein